MSLKKEVIQKLESHKGEFFSGEELARELSVSRAAVWKVMKQLENEGYEIEAVTNKGYCLSISNDKLSEEGIRPFLRTQFNMLPIQIDQICDSTNNQAKQAAVEGALNGSIFLAEKQTMGKGRRGRSFQSLNGAGIYLSVLLKPKMQAADALFITTAASVAVYRAILAVTGKKTQIKWVNDLFYNGKKICGILTEAVTDCENGMIESLVVGIGINFNIKAADIVEELKNTVGSLYDGTTKESRNRLIAEVINELLSLCADLEDRSFLKDYRENSMILGKDIVVVSSDFVKDAKAISIDEMGGLVVQYADKTIQTLNTGEISIRKKQSI